jgi:hypothetical protein
MSTIQTARTLFLDVEHGIAHLLEDCPGYKLARVTAEASPGTLTGFVLCCLCANVEGRRHSDVES